MYLVAGILTGLAGVLEFSTLTVGDPTDSVGLELEVIAAVVIGGGSLSGGQGSIFGTLLGALLLTFIATGCTHWTFPIGFRKSSRASLLSWRWVWTDSDTSANESLAAFTSRVWLQRRS